MTRLEQKPLFTGMTLDSVGLSFIAAHELGPAGDQAGTFTETPSGPSGGFAAKPYTNPAGNAAIGYGHLLHDGSVNGTDQATYPNPIDQAQASLLLTQDTATAVDAVNADVKVVLKQDQFDGWLTSPLTRGAASLRSLRCSRMSITTNSARCRRSWSDGSTASSSAIRG